MDRRPRRVSRTRSPLCPLSLRRRWTLDLTRAAGAALERLVALECARQVTFIAIGCLLAVFLSATLIASLICHPNFAFPNAS